MWVNLAAGVLHFPTTERTDSIDIRLELLQRALTALKGYRDGLVAKDPAPKYLAEHK